jgi:hypothetical protein
MALAKFYEDNFERLLEDRDNLFPPYLLDAIPPLLPPEPRSGWMELRESGRLVDDREVFVANYPLNFSVRWQDDAEKPHGSLHPPLAGAEKQVAPDAAGGFALKLSVTGLYELRLRCGLHEMRFRLESVTSPDFGSVRRIQQELAELCATTKSWTREQLDAMRQRLLPRGQPPEAPRDFCDGLMEYHLALLLEKERRPEAGGHFECAYTLLRPYTKYSPQAAFIASYFLYRINNFESLAKVPPSHSRFVAMCAFFHRPYDEVLKAPVPQDKRRPASFPMVIAGADEALLAAVGRLVADDLAGAEEQIAHAKREQSQVTRDGSAEMRLHFVAARLQRRKRDVTQACFYYAQLDVRTNSVFGREATQYLEEHRRR